MFDSCRYSCMIFLALLCIQTYLIVPSIASKVYVDPDTLSKQGDEALASGDYDKAIRFYSEAINADSSNFQFFWKRSIPFMQRGKFREALGDLNRVLSLDSKNINALFRRAKLLLSVGKFEDSLNDLSKLLKLKPDHAEALELLPSVRSIDDQFHQASDLIRQGNVDQGILILNSVLEKAPIFEKGLLLRARQHFKSKRLNEVLEDMTHLLKSSPTNTAALYLRGKALLYTGDEDTAMTHFEQCLQYDSFNTECKNVKEGLNQYKQNFQKALKALDAGKNREAIKLIESCLAFDPNWDHIMPTLYEKLTRAYLGVNDGMKALEAVDKMISYDDKIQVSFILKGEAYLLLEEWDKAINEMQNALNLGQTNEAWQAKQKAEKMKFMASRKDYYKILGLEKTATKREISKAYRKLSMKYHPDKSSEENAEKMYRDVTEAYDVLNDEEKKRKYDNGEDVQGQQQQPQHGHPFANFFYGFH